VKQVVEQLAVVGCLMGDHGCVKADVLKEPVCGFACFVPNNVASANITTLAAKIGEPAPETFINLHLTTIYVVGHTSPSLPNIFFSLWCPTLCQWKLLINSVRSDLHLIS